DGRSAGDIAIFYRANAQSRALEDQLIRVGLPYRVVGGTRFYERREIKDAVAYLQVVTNSADEINLRRILNVPKREIGDRAEAAIAMLAERERIGFGEALRRAEEAPGIATRSLNAVRTFVAMLDDLQQMAADGAGPADLLETILQRSGYYAELQGSDDPQDESRLENLAEPVRCGGRPRRDRARRRLCGRRRSRAGGGGRRRHRSRRGPERSGRSRGEPRGPLPGEGLPGGRCGPDPRRGGPVRHPDDAPH